MPPEPRAGDGKRTPPLFQRGPLGVEPCGQAVCRVSP